MSWRVGSHYDVHVYENDRPVGTFHSPVDAARAVAAVNDGEVLLYSAPAVEAALDGQSGILVVSHCGYPLLLVMGEDGVTCKSPGDDYAVYDDDECCWPYRQVWP